jgi:hypothetical protein
MTAIEALYRFFSDIAEGIRKFVQAITDWFNSPQVRRFFRCLANAARRAGLIQESKALPRRKQRSTKRAMIYQRKMALVAIDNP